VTHHELRGLVVPGRGLGAARLADDRVLELIEELFGIRVVPGTLNVRLAVPFDRSLASRHVAASELDPGWEDATGQAGYRLLPVLVAGRHRAIAFQAEEPGYPEDLLEIMCDVHLRSTLGLEDGDAISLTVRPESEPPSSPRGRSAGSRFGAAVGSSLFFLLAPAVVAGLLPWSITRWRGDEAPWPLRAAGFTLLGAGVLVLLFAFARFVTEGVGTPAPVRPTKRLVIGGLYRYVRNPMYLAVLAAIVGQALVLGRPILLAYAGVVALAFVMFVRGYEEPTLSRTFGEAYEAYRRAVPGWWPRRRPWTPD
jgi:protein-S-isoprenylcysteine O-methyltransferase Ste14